MTGTEVLGQGRAWQRALERARALRLHHGVLLEGPRGAGKSTAARVLARALLCEGDDDAGSCGRCPACARVDTGAHADLHLVGVPEDKQDIPIDAVRELQSTLLRRAMEGRARVAIIDPADRLGEQAQNALLKLLEEPGEAVFLLLATSRPEDMLPTVRSRVARLRLLRLGDEEVERQLAGKKIGDDGSRRLAASLAGGSVGLAADLVEAEIGPAHQDLVAFLERPNDMSAVELARRLLGPAGTRLEADRRARLILACARAVARGMVSGALAQSVGSSYGAAGFAPWAAVIDRLLEAEADLDLRIGAEQALCYALLGVQQDLSTQH